MKKYKKAVNTGVSRAVPHLSTNPAFFRLTSEFGWDPVHLEEYGRQRMLSSLVHISTPVTSINQNY